MLNGDPTLCLFTCIESVRAGTDFKPDFKSFRPSYNIENVIC